MTTPFLLLIEGGKLLAIANNFFPDLGGPWRQGETVSDTLRRFTSLTTDLMWVNSELVWVKSCLIVHFVISFRAFRHIFSCFSSFLFVLFVIS